MWPRDLVTAVSVGAVYGLLALEAPSPLAVVLLVWVIAILILAWRLPVKATDLAASRVAVEARSLDLRELRPVLATNGSDPFPSATRGECRHSRVISLLQCRERRHSRVWSCSAGSVSGRPGWIRILPPCGERYGPPRWRSLRPRELCLVPGWSARSRPRERS